MAIPTKYQQEKMNPIRAISLAVLLLDRQANLCNWQEFGIEAYQAALVLRKLKRAVEAKRGQVRQGARG